MRGMIAQQFRPDPVAEDPGWPDQSLLVARRDDAGQGTCPSANVEACRPDFGVWRVQVGTQPKIPGGMSRFGAGVGAPRRPWPLFYDSSASLWA